jgi:hypothetical protein
LIRFAYAYFEQEILDRAAQLKVPQWLKELIVSKGLSFALDVQNTLAKRYMEKEIYAEMCSISDASKIDFKLLVRMHMFGELMRGKDYRGVLGSSDST